MLSALLTGLLCSCQQETIRIIEPNETFSVTFYSKDGQIIDSQTIKYGSTVRKPVNPTKTGYTFKSWNYTDNNGNNVEYPFSLAVTQDLSLTAEYSANSYTINFEKN
ncbi:MAG: InlB B-repeat-containing protein [Treponema sp.]|nr:InlB B-repeat-containing protein [Treponema sp.]